MKIKNSIFFLIAIFEFLMGAIGICLSIFWVMPFISFWGGTILLIMGIIYMIAGHLLLKRRKKGYQLSLILQTLGLPIINSKIIIFEFIYLFGVYGFIDKNPVRHPIIEAYLTLFQFSFYWADNQITNGTHYIAINFIALFIIIFLFMYRYSLIEEYRHEALTDFLIV